MRLSELSKPQWDAARAAAGAALACNPHNPADRAAYRNAKARLSGLLPEGADALGIIEAAMRWEMNNALAEALMGAGMEIISNHQVDQEGGGDKPNKRPPLFS